MRIFIQSEQILTRITRIILVLGKSALSVPDTRVSGSSLVFNIILEISLYLDSFLQVEETCCLALGEMLLKPPGNFVVLQYVCCSMTIKAFYSFLFYVGGMDGAGGMDARRQRREDVDLR